MAKRAGRFLKQQKLTDEQFRRIVRCFAFGLSAQQAATTSDRDKRSNTSRNAIYVIYGQLRRRLYDIGYFPSMETIDRFLDEETVEPPLTPRRGLALYAIAVVRHMRGVRESTIHLHLSEVVFRLTNCAQNPEIAFTDIMRLVKITGPLNASPRNQAKADAYMTYRVHAACVARLRSVRLPAGFDEGHRDLLRGHLAEMERLDV